MNTSSNQWKAVAKLAYDFLNSLPHGWLAHTSGDVGLLNDFYIAYRNANKPDLMECGSHREKQTP